MRRFALLGIAAALVGCGSTPIAKMKHGQISEPVIPNHDVELAKAVKRAQVSLGTFIDRLSNPKALDQAFFIKTRVSSTGGEGSIWVTDLKFDDDVFSGRVDTAPPGLGHRPGEDILVYRDKVIDWKIISDDIVEGAFTEEVWQMRTAVLRSPNLQQGFLARL